MGHIQQFQPMAPWLLIMLFFVSCFSTVGVIRQKRTVSWLGSSGGLKIRRSSFNSNTVHLCAGSGDRNGLQNHSGWFESICALAAWCNGSTQDLGSCDIGSNPMAAASHSSKGKDRGFLSGRSGVRIPPGTAGEARKFKVFEFTSLFLHPDIQPAIGDGFCSGSRLTDSNNNQQIF